MWVQYFYYGGNLSVLTTDQPITNNDTVFSVFRRKAPFLSKGKEGSESLRYQLEFDAYGAYLELYNGKEKISLPDFRLYSGPQRTLLSFLKEVKEKEFFSIRWDNSPDHFYFSEYPEMLALLADTGNFFLNEKPLTIMEKAIRLKMQIIPDNERFEVRILADSRKKFRFVNGKYILIGEMIQRIDEPGADYNNLERFNTQMSMKSLDLFLAITASAYTGLDFEYDTFYTKPEVERRTLRPALLFESVTEENELIMRLSAVIGNLEPGSANEFNISRYVKIDHEERILKVFECDYSAVQDTYLAILKSLNSLKPGRKGDALRENDGRFILSQELASNFILNHLQEYVGLCELYGSDTLRTYKYVTAKPSLNINFRESIDYLEGNDVTVQIENDKLTIFDLLSLYQKHNYIPLSDGNKAIIEKAYIRRLARLFKKDGKRIKISFFDLPEIERLISEKNQRIFQHSNGFYKGMTALPSVKTRMPALNNVTLRPYQKYGIKWLKYLYDNDFGACLADDMGLGKTVQAIGLLSMIYPKTKAPSLIVLPKSLIVNWQNELNRFNPNLSFYLHYGLARDHEAISKYNLTITSYATLRNDIKYLRNIEFDTVFLDESQNIKNLESQSAKAVMLLKAKHRFALSGTPVENSLFELYSLFRFLNPGMFSNLKHFKDDYAIPVQTEGDEHTARILKAKISPFILRRLKQDVLKELPPKQEQMVYVDLEDEHARFYHQRRLFFKQALEQQIEINGIENSRFAILQAFTELRQIASVPEIKSEMPITSSKIDVLFDMLADIISNKHKVLIFMNFLGAIDAIADKADALGYSFLVMTGSTRNRQELIDQFQNDPSIHLFLMTLKTGGLGVNLTAADYVFIFDPWWNLAAENQAIDRTHRIGQKNTVFSYKLISRGTIEEKIAHLQKMKKDLTDAVISGDEGGLKVISNEDLSFILG
jgi:SNF2 family DNA or RNA helicase